MHEEPKEKIMSKKTMKTKKLFYCVNHSWNFDYIYNSNHKGIKRLIF